MPNTLVIDGFSHDEVRFRPGLLELLRRHRPGLKPWPLQEVRHRHRGMAGNNPWRRAGRAVRNRPAPRPVRRG